MGGLSDDFLKNIGRGKVQRARHGNFKKKLDAVNFLADAHANLGHSTIIDDRVSVTSSFSVTCFLTMINFHSLGCPKRFSFFLI